MTSTILFILISQALQFPLLMEAEDLKILEILISTIMCNYSFAANCSITWI
jgi:hypothetical protein